MDNRIHFTTMAVAAFAAALPSCRSSTSTAASAASAASAHSVLLNALVADTLSISSNLEIQHPLITFTRPDSSVVVISAAKVSMASQGQRSSSVRNEVTLRDTVALNRQCAASTVHRTPVEAASQSVAKVSPMVVMALCVALALFLTVKSILHKKP